MLMTIAILGQADSLSSTSALMPWLVAVATLVVGLVGGWGVAAWRAKGLLSQAQEQSRQIIRDSEAQARDTADAKLSEADQEIARRRQGWEDEEEQARQRMDEAENEIQSRHRRLQDRDRALTRRDQLINKREADVERRSKKIDTRRDQLEQQIEQVSVRLEEVSALTREEARRQLLDSLRAEVRQSAAADVRSIKEELYRNADLEAQKILALATERLASDYSSERNVAHLKLADPAMRGRIIGSEGRNIRAFENTTGMQLVLDEQPDQVQISGFHPVNREIARRSLEKLVDDGVIHPKRIQHVVANTRRKVDQEIARAGREAVKEFRIRGMNNELVTLLGRLKYRTSYGQNVLDHVKEVAHLCGMMAVELKLDQKLAQRAALLHDVGKAVDFEREGTHPEIGGKIARRCGEHEIVINAIESHHDDCEAIHPISTLVAAADALSGARPGARRRTTVDYIRRISKLEELGHAMGGVESCYALQAGREVRVIVQPGKISDDDAALMAHELSQRIQSEMDYPGRIKVTVIRELKAQARAH